MTDDDWQPLPPEELCRRPGDAADVQKRRAAPQRPPAVATAAGHATTPATAGAVPRSHGPEPSASPPHPAHPPHAAHPAAPSAPPVPSAEEQREAERALAALQARLAHTPAATSLVAEVAHREQKAARRQRAAAVPELAATVVARPPACAASVATASSVEPPWPQDTRVDGPWEEAPDAVPSPAPTPPPPARAAGPSPAALAGAGGDPRELEPWFAELPAAERERLRAVWFAARHRDDDAGRVRRRRLQRALVYGGSLFLVLGLLQSLLLGSLHLVLPMAIAGAIAALVAEACGGGRFVYAGCGGIAFAIVLGANVFAAPFSLMTILIAAYGMGLIGMDGEMRRSGGFGDRDPPVTAPPPAPRS